MGGQSSYITPFYYFKFNSISAMPLIIIIPKLGKLYEGYKRKTGKKKSPRAAFDGCPTQDRVKFGDPFTLLNDVNDNNILDRLRLFNYCLHQDIAYS